MKMSPSYINEHQMLQLHVVWMMYSLQHVNLTACKMELIKPILQMKQTFERCSKVTPQGASKLGSNPISLIRAPSPCHTGHVLSPAYLIKQADFTLKGRKQTFLSTMNSDSWN
jgi:hypothetical protein